MEGIRRIILHGSNFFIYNHGGLDMALARSLAIGAGALQAQQQLFDVVSNNMANVNTLGFKSGSVSFTDQLNQTITHGKSPDSIAGIGVGGVDPKQLGLGVKVGAIRNDMSQGAIEGTNRPLDMAIQGEGFFVYNMNGQELYSRAGAVSRDKNGFLVDSATGAYLQGYNLETDARGRTAKDSEGNNVLVRKAENLQIANDIISQPSQTQNVSVTGNLNAGMLVGESKTTSIKIFDNVGTARDLEITFTKSANANEFAVTMNIQGKAITPSSSTVTFNADGTLNSPLSFLVTAQNLNTALGGNVFDATTPKNINIKLADTGNLLGGLTQFSGPNSATTSAQDGYAAGSLNSLSVDYTGKIWGTFTNGQSEALGQTVLAKFTNPGGLVKEGSNFYRNSPNSGLAYLGTAGEVFPSTSIAGESIEHSNVELTTEFTKMIEAQRAYETAARIITVMDQILAQATILKR